MPITNFAEISNNQGAVSSSYQRTYSKTFLIETDSPTVSVWEVGSYPGLPKIFDVYPHDPTGRAFCVNLSPVQDSDNPCLWKVTASYAYTIDGWTGGGGGGGATATGNPLIDSQQQGVPPAERVATPIGRPRDYSYSTAVVGQEPIREEIIGGQGPPAPIVNTADDPFSSPPMRTIAGLQITVSMNSLEPPGGNWVAALHKLNTNPLTIDRWTIPAKWARLESCSASKVYEEGVSYYRWTVVFLIREKWTWDVLSIGNRAYFDLKNKATGAVEKKKVAITEVDRYLTGPQLLDADGRVVTKKAGNHPAKLSFEIYESVVFPSPL